MSRSTESRRGRTCLSSVKRYSGVSVEKVWIQFGERPWTLHVEMSQGISFFMRPPSLGTYKEFKEYQRKGQTLTIEHGPEEELSTMKQGRKQRVEDLARELAEAEGQSALWETFIGEAERQLHEDEVTEPAEFTEIVEDAEVHSMGSLKHCLRCGGFFIPVEMQPESPEPGAPLACSKCRRLSTVLDVLERALDSIPPSFKEIRREIKEVLDV